MKSPDLRRTEDLTAPKGTNYPTESQFIETTKGKGSMGIKLRL